MRKCKEMVRSCTRAFPVPEMTLSACLRIPHHWHAITARGRCAKKRTPLDARRYAFGCNDDAFGVGRDVGRQPLRTESRPLLRPYGPAEHPTQGRVQQQRREER